MMSNKFLGLDSVNVLKDYIDNKILSHDTTSRILTIQAYRYAVNSENVETPIGGGFDVNGARVEYPAGWKSLATLNDELIASYGSIESALEEGMIYMSAGVIDGDAAPIWSVPMKISGQNGIGVKFKFTYNNDPLTDSAIDALSDVPHGVDASHPYEWVYTKTAETNWQGPALWATYAANATNIIWRYCVTQDANVPAKPRLGDSLWSADVPTQSLSAEYPYMWMCSQVVPANENGVYPEPTGNNWVGPILFGHYGMDGTDGSDGSVPDYLYTLYCQGTDDPALEDLPGIVPPSKPTLVSNKSIQDYITDGWVELPTDSNKIWWQCAFKVDGKSDKVLEIGAVVRYTAVDGTAKPGPFTKFIYKWSEDQSVPGVSGRLVDGWRPEDWSESPERPLDALGAEASLWMIACNATGVTAEGYPDVADRSLPVRLSGPRGALSYDYRMETRYIRGTETAPEDTPDNVEWTKDVPSDLNTSYPYIWAKNYLVYYKMKYADYPNIDGTYDVIQESDVPTIVEDINGVEIDYAPYRLSGLNGMDGNKKNTVHYASRTATINVTSFANTNLYVSNADNAVIYNIEFDNLSFINGYTGKFANIGTSTVVINSNDIQFVGSNTTANSITLDPQESVELICYKNGNTRTLLVIGKALA